MRYDLKVACKSCPFRKDDGKGKGRPVRLMRGRIIEIHNCVTRWHGGEFPCHKTVKRDDEDERIRGDHERHCAGAIAYAAKQGDGSQVARFGVHALGTGDPADYGPPEAVFDSLYEFERSALDYDEDDGPEPCTTANHGCLAPAGIMTTGGIEIGTESADGECVECGEPLCSNCASESGRCDSCEGWYEAEDVPEEPAPKKRKKSPRPLVE